MPIRLFFLIALFATNVCTADEPASTFEQINRDVWSAFIAGVNNYDDDAYLETRSKHFVMADGVGRQFLDHDYYVEDSVAVMKGLREAGVKLDAQVRFDDRYSDGEYAFERGILRIASTDAAGKTNVGLTRFQAVSRNENGRWRVLTEHRWRDPAVDQATFDAARAPDDFTSFKPAKPASK